MKKLPIKRFILKTDEDGMDYMGIVDEPAHGKPFFMFSKSHRIDFKLNEERREVYGVAVSVNQPIYRNDDNGEYYGVFLKEDVKEIQNRFFKRLHIHNVNTNHDRKETLKDVTLIFSYTIDKEKGFNVPDLFKNQRLEDGSWILGYKINSEKEWERVKSGEFTGFSIEIFADVTNLNFNKMKKPIFGSLFSKSTKKNFEEATTIDGQKVKWEGEPVIGETIIYLVDEDGNEIQAPPGEYAIAEGEEVYVLIVDESGILQEVKREEDSTEEGDQTEMETVSVEEFKALKVEFEEIKKANMEFKKAIDSLSKREPLKKVNLPVDNNQSNASVFNVLVKK